MNTVKLLVDPPEGHLQRCGDVTHRHAPGPKGHELVRVYIDPRPAQPDPSLLGPFESGSGSVSDPESFLFGYPPTDGKEQAAYWATCIEPGLPHGDDLDPTSVKIDDRLQSPDHASVQPIQRPDQHHLELPSMGIGQHLLEC